MKNLLALIVLLHVAAFFHAQQIANTKRIAAVVLNGRYLSKDNLDGLLADVESRVKAR